MTYSRRCIVARSGIGPADRFPDTATVHGREHDPFLLNVEVTNTYPFDRVLDESEALCRRPDEAARQQRQHRHRSTRLLRPVDEDHDLLLELVQQGLLQVRRVLRSWGPTFLRR